MRIAGQRADGALYLSLGGGIAVVLKGNRVTPPLDEMVVDTMGPWVSASNMYEERVRVERLLNCANLANVEYFLLAAAFEYGQRAEPDPDAGGAEPVSQSTGPDPNAVSQSPDPDAVGLSPDPDTISKSDGPDPNAVSQSLTPAAPATPAKKNPFAKGKVKRPKSVSPVKAVKAKGIGVPRAKSGVGVGRVGVRALRNPIVTMAKAAAQWRLSADSASMQQNIARNAIYRVVAQGLEASAAFGTLTDEDLFALADELTDTDLVILAAAFGVEKEDEDEDMPFEEEGEGEGESEEEGDEDAVALDKFHSLDKTAENKDEKEPVSEIAKVAQEGEAAAPAPTEEVMNLPPANLPPAPVVGPGDPIVVVSPEDRKKRREQLKEKIKKAARSKGRIGDVLGDEEVDDEDLFAMAKELGVPLDETPDAVTLIDNAEKFARLLASTSIAKHIHLAGGEHPFQYCIDNVIPAMEKEGKAPDDPEAFCAYWKQENGG